MKTLNKKITAGFFLEPEGYYALRARWSQLVRDPEARKQLTAAHHVLYQMLRGKDWQKAISPVSSTRKLENGGFFAWKGRKAVLLIMSVAYDEELLAPFATVVQKEALAAIRELLPVLRWDENPLDREPYCD